MAALPLQIGRVVLAVVASASLLCTAPGQQRSSSDRPIVPVIGTVTGITDNVISVHTGATITDVYTSAHTEIWKGKTFHDLSPVQIGDDFSARCRKDASGKLVAEVVWLNIVNFFGVITAVNGNTFEMLTNPNADPQSAYVKKTLKVSVDAKTVFDASAKGDLRAGRDVQMVGLDLKDGTVGARRLTVYAGKRPVRMKGGKVIPPNGKVVKDR